MNISSFFASEQLHGTAQSIMEDSIDSIQEVFPEKTFLSISKKKFDQYLLFLFNGNTSFVNCKRNCDEEKKNNQIQENDPSKVFH
jgi:hypothetical protein